MVLGNDRTVESLRPLTEIELIENLQRGQVVFPPASLEYFPLIPELRLDGGLSVTWFDRTADFAFEYKALSTPKAIDEATMRVLEQLRGYDEFFPLIIVPYLSEAALNSLASRLVSGLDLCGNGLIIAPNKFWLRRVGEPNRFKGSPPLRNVFRGTSSLVARCLLLRETFESLTDLQDFAVNCMPQAFGSRGDTILSKGTVSKAIQVLEEDRIVAKDKNGIRLIARGVLLEKLEVNHRKSHEKSISGKTDLAPEEVWSALASSQMLYVATGVGSASHYGLISPLERQQLYVENLSLARELLALKPTKLFPTVELIEEKSPVAYFDARVQGEESWASPIQTLLELSVGDPRERVAAQQLRSTLSGKELP